jgi:acid phosphatase (class A)
MNEFSVNQRPRASSPSKLEKLAMRLFPHHRIATLTAFAALVFCAAQLPSQTAPQPAAQARKPIFVLPEQLDMAAILPTPPAGDSPQGAAELAEVHRLQNTRTPAEIARAKADDAEEDMFIFKDVLGEKFQAKYLPATAVLSAHVHNDESFISNPAKVFFHRLRPYVFDATVQPVCKIKEDPKDYSYPSGHSVTGYLEALVTAMMVPEKRDAILARADDYAHNRLVCGMHYPSDLAASKTVAYSMIGLMINHPQFRHEFEAAKAETRQALGFSGL